MERRLAIENQSEVSTGYTPRPLQAELHRALRRFNVLVCHRRFGKTVFSINEMIDRGLRCTRENPRYAYIAPLYSQAKRVAWDYLKAYTRDIPGVKTNEHELRVDLEGINNARFMLLGADNPDSLRGIYLDGVILDEYAEMSPRAWSEVIRPALADREGWSIFIGCVTSDTLIIGDQGLEEIGTCPEGYTEEDKQVYGLGGFHKAEDRYGNPTLPTKKIRTKAGLELEATPNHKVWTPSGWVRMDELGPGDPLFMQVNQQVYGTESCDSDYAWFLGLYLAEGNMERNIYRVTISSGDDFIHEQLEKLFGFKRYDKFHSRKNSKEFCANLCEWFPDAGKTRAPGKTLSSRVLNLTKNNLESLLSGYFDGDGTVNGGQMVSCVTSSEKLSRQLQCLFLNMGYRATRREQLTQPTEKVKVSSLGYVVALESDSAVKFAREIGFALTRKQEKTKNWERKTGHQYWFNRDDFGVLTAKYGYLRRCHKISRRVLDDIDPHGKVYDKQLLADEVVEVKDSEAPTYDFCIPDTHSYFSNGLVSHNTPKGRNHFYKIHEYAKEDEDWYTAIYDGEKTNVLPAKELKYLKKTMDDPEYDQEIRCKFDTVLVGAYYQKELTKAQKDERITDVPHDPALLVHTAWDIGIADKTAIWFYQQNGNRTQLIEYIELDDDGLDSLCRMVKDKTEYNYGEHFFPWDIKARDLSTGNTRLQTVQRLLPGRTIVVPRQKVEDGINAARLLIPKCFFNVKKCEKGLDALKNYRRKWNPKEGQYTNTPVHNWASHGADAFRYLALGLREDAAERDLPRQAETDYDIFGI